MASDWYAFMNTTLSPWKIACINETRQAIAIGEIADERQPIADGQMSYTRGVAWNCHTTAVGLTCEVTDDDIEQIILFYESRSMPANIELTTFASEDFLGKLRSRGFGLVHVENVLACPLGSGDDPFARMPFGLPDGLTIERTDPDDTGALRMHALLASSGFHTPANPASEKELELMERSIRHPRSVGFVAFVNSQPAAACGMEICSVNGVKACALWGTSVNEAYRHRGVQQALIAHRLTYAISQRCSLAVIESKPGIATERNAARMGFGLSYVRLILTRPLSQ